MVPVKNPTNDLKRSLKACIEEITQLVGFDQVSGSIGQFKILFKKLNTSQKLNCLKDKMHRAVIVELIAR